MTAARRSPPLVVLLSSPLLGGIVWEGVTPMLRERDREVVVPPDVDVRAHGSVEAMVAEVLATLPADRPLAIVAHSNAGNLVPGIVAARDVSAVVLVDAVLPAHAGPHPVAPPPFVRRLATLADDRGLLPPWTTWFPDEAIAGLGLDAAQLARLRAAEPRVPYSYLAGTFEVPHEWARATPGAFVSFGDGYASERRLAASLGWRVRAVEGGHLHPLAAPEEVAAVIDEELTELTEITELGGSAVTAPVE